MASVLITDSNFQSEVLDSKIPVMVDFWAPWCGPCQMAGPIIEELSEELKDKLKVGKLNVDENTQISSQHGVMSIPTIIIFKDGKEAGRQVGFAGKEGYKKLISQFVN